MICGLFTCLLGWSSMRCAAVSAWVRFCGGGHWTADEVEPWWLTIAIAVNGRTVEEEALLEVKRLHLVLSVV